MKLFAGAQPLPQHERHMTLGMDGTVDERQQRFLDLFLPTRERLWRFVRAHTRAHADTVNEIMSETVFRAYQRFEHLRDESAFRAYCFRIARRVAAEMLKKSRRQAATDPQDLPEYCADGPSPEQSADISLLYDLLNTLPPKMRETIVLFEVADCTLEEIRAIQGGTLSGVKSRLVRARAQLASLMGDTTAESQTTASSTDSDNQPDFSYVEPTALHSSAS